MTDLALPTFAMDCRDWLVVTPSDADLPDDVAGTPLLAVLSTVVLDDGEFRPASGVLTVGLLDHEPPPSVPVAPGTIAELLVEADDDPTLRRYLIPAPDRRLAMLAEFTLPDGPDPRVLRRLDALLASFRWTA